MIDLDNILLMTTFDCCNVCGWVGLSDDVINDLYCPVCGSYDMDDIDAYFASLKRDGEIEVEGLSFKVQIGAYRNPPKKSYFDFLKNVGGIEIIEENELTKFRLGDFKTLVETEIIRLSVIDQGVEDAFVIAYISGVRISMREAIEILCSKK